MLPEREGRRPLRRELARLGELRRRALPVAALRRRAAYVRLSAALGRFERAARLGGLREPFLRLTLATLLPHLRRTAAATWRYVPLVPLWFARASAFFARASVSMGYERVLG